MTDSKSQRTGSMTAQRNNLKAETNKMKHLARSQSTINLDPLQTLNLCQIGSTGKRTGPKSRKNRRQSTHMIPMPMSR